MKQSFLKVFQDRLLSRSVPLENQIAVLPTRRAASFLKKSLSETILESSWLPQFTTINAWTEEITGLKSADPLQLKFACFDAYQKTMGATAQDVSAFFSWADVLLGDFNDIEGYMVSPELIFKELKDYTDIEHFSFLNEPLSPKQENYQRFWKAIPLIHKALNETLLASGLGYPGLIARKAVEHYDTWARSRGDFFVTIGGFNALSEAESALLLKAQESGRAEILFDADQFYLNQKANHAGLFLRKNAARKLGKNVLTMPSLHERALDISIGEAGSRVEQASMIAAMISGIPQNELSETALVLADESLLIPVLNRLPESVQSANITMGIGLLDTVFADWLGNIWECHETGVFKEGRFHFSTEHLRKLALQPVTVLLNKLCSETSGLKLPAYENFLDARQMAETAKNDNLGWLSPLLMPWDHSSDKAAEALRESMEQTLELLRGLKAKSPAHRIVGESAVWIQRITKKMVATAGFSNLRPAVMLNILLRELSNASLALVGEPLQGLQIMGILETRALGFKNLVICSANEDILPRKAKIDSFIPFEIRRYHHLPGKREKEAVYAYHFYRMIQHAEKVSLVFHSDTTDSKGSEKSRYLHQITFELARENEQVKIKEIALAKETRPFTERVLEVQKTPEVIERIKNAIATKISASAINRYFDSPLEWYYGYVLRLAQPETSMELDPATFGNLVHKALEELKKPVFGQSVTAAMLDAMIAAADAELRKQFTANEKSKQFEYGLNHLHFEMASEMVRRYLISEKDCIQRGESIEYLDAEMALSRSLVFDWDGETIEANFSGVADSVQKRDGRIYIIDFKTGMVSDDHLSVKEFTIDIVRKKPKAMQLLLYNWMGRKKFPNQSIASQIISMPKPGVRDLVMKTDVNSDENETAFESLLVEILRDMLDSSKSIAADQEFKYNVYE